MSHNKDIKNLHYITGEPYSICRQRLKAAKWRIERALFLYSIDPLSITIEKISAALTNFSNAVSDALKKIDFKAFENCEKEEG